MVDRGPARPRLVDVARRAGVSTATASLVLRGRPGPSEATARSVREAAAALGYRPDRTASLLARHRSRLIGVLLDVTSPFHAELVRALDDEAAERDLDLVLSTVTARRDEARAAETLLDFRCEALVLLGPAMSDPALDALPDSVPTVVVGRRGTARVPGVLVSDDQGLELVVDHLAALGHRRIAFVDGPRGSIAAARRAGYRAAMRRHGGATEVDVLAGGATEEAGVRAARHLLARRRGEPPTAVVCFNDRCAIGLRDTVLRAGLDLPGELSVVGYDDSPLARLGTVDLTSVSQEPGRLAHATVQLLAAVVRGDGVGGADVVIDPRLVVRSSSGPPAAARSSSPDRMS
ncbi:LacI family DNA-binding transcriptional regulator [Phycicoccus sonneratiae]|uniref:LacI family DNA-binding transcriptional regulator n=1 Tax=Phycicoccus sonneratiae TaxID=2807628 RepID=A0ABS2CS06_9MICO|nr:LacI family DNA-binding transcriptional regulator [Phycicoccus sonneraticus]MBM6402600.1 LacI family DNA-binding transcriptional regulator [Phycicoccus sonneraticus]